MSECRPTFGEALRVTPWAVEFRDGDTIDDELDRDAAITTVAAVLTWAAERLRPESVPDRADR